MNYIRFKKVKLQISLKAAPILSDQRFFKRGKCNKLLKVFSTILQKERVVKYPIFLKKIGYLKVDMKTKTFADYVVVYSAHQAGLVHHGYHVQ